MRGIFYFDVLFASFIALVAVMIGMQLIGNITHSNHTRLDSLQLVGISVSNRIVYTCYPQGVAYCDYVYTRGNEIDLAALAFYSLPEDVLKYAASNNVTIKVGFDNEKTSGFYCIIRVLKIHGETREARLRICVE